MVKSSIFWIGIAVFGVGYLLSLGYGGVNTQLVKIVGIFLFLYAASSLILLKLNPSYFHCILLLLISWNISIVFRGFNFTYGALKNYLFEDYLFWPFIIPLVSLFEIRSTFIRIIFLFCSLSCICYVVVSIFLFHTYFFKPEIGETCIWWLASGSGFLLLTWKYHTFFRKILALSTSFLAFYIATGMARRNVMITVSCFLLFSFLLYLFYYSKNNLNQKIVSIVLFLSITLGGSYFFLEKKGSDFKLVMSRFNENTREYVFDYYFEDMKGSYLFGKGMNSTYYCPLKDENETNGVILYRNLIESGYLQILLNGGLISLILFIFLTLPAIFLGVFFSKNGLVKGAALFILAILVDMFPYGIPALSVKYLLMWIFIGICYNPQIRKMSESQITEYLNIH
jgi:O-Antigen ligase